VADGVSVPAGASHQGTGQWRSASALRAQPRNRGGAGSTERPAARTARGSHVAGVRVGSRTLRRELTMARPTGRFDPLKLRPQCAEPRYGAIRRAPSAAARRRVPSTRCHHSKPRTTHTHRKVPQTFPITPCRIRCRRSVAANTGSPSLQRSKALRLPPSGPFRSPYSLQPYAPASTGTPNQGYSP